jgi:hypothetical protein
MQKHIMKIPFRCCLLLFVVSLVAHSQTDPKTSADVYVDKEGNLKWNGSNDEVSLFGVNYTVPFAYSYRAHKRLGLSLKKAIDLDVEQMARLGFDAFRVHVWDREISDGDGNILKNEHLDLFDYLLAKLAEHNIKSIITPIAWWGNGYPEPEETSLGFSQKYPRLELITNPKAREAERNYLKQFISHTNQYRKLSYRNDPFIIAIEIINEPTHPENGQEVTNYINEMVGVFRQAGFTKPVFYNISQNWSDVQANAVTKANVEGISFQWYPTDLVHQKMLKGNYLLNVDKYAIPSENVAGYSTKAKMVYEFDVADVGGSYMYPAVVRSFREAGMQFATMFSYDPTQIAWSNTEYQTHFMNLLYTPSKALSLMIAGRAFHQLPRNKSFGSYPANNQFDDFRVSYEEDLSEMNGDAEFIYSNSTSTQPKNVLLLQHIAGCGNSSVVQYDGTGAYFLDKLEQGIWKLEIYPDVLWLRDPFEPTSMSQQVARLFWNQRQMKINLPDLGNEYVLYPLSDTKWRIEKIFGSGQLLRPGEYLVTEKNADNKNLHKYLSKKRKFLEGLYTPSPIAPNIYVVNKTDQYSNEMNPSVFKFQIAGEQKVVNASLYIRRFGWRGFAKHPLKNIGGFEYVIADSPKILQSGNLEYCVAVESGGKEYTFPGGVQSTPGKWDFIASNYWSLKILGADEPIVLLNVTRDRKDFVFPQYDRSRRYSIEYKNGTKSDETSLSLKITSSEQQKLLFGFQLNVASLKGLLPDRPNSDRYFVVSGRSLEDSTSIIGLLFLMSDGTCCGVNIELKKNIQEIKIPLSDFRNMRPLMLPNAYPLFLSKTWNEREDTLKQALNLRLIEFIQVVVDPKDGKSVDGKRENNFEIQSIFLK